MGRNDTAQTDRDPDDDLDPAEVPDFDDLSEEDFLNDMNVVLADE